MTVWKIKGLYKADAQAVYEEITQIGEEVTPEQIVDKAKDKDTELHKCFCWDNKAAAHLYRLSQARSIMRNIVHTVEYQDEETGEDEKITFRAIICTNENKNKYETIQRCVENPESFARLRASMLKDLNAFKHRYEVYSQIRREFFDLFETIETITT